MNLDKLRDELLEEHDSLRADLASLRGMARRVSDGERDARLLFELRTLLTATREKLRRHSAKEDKLLGPLLRTLDAWGPQREKILETAHQHEHEAFEDAFLRAFAEEDPGKLSEIVRLLTRELSVHMKTEEQYLLNKDVLTESLITSGQSSG